MAVALPRGGKLPRGANQRDDEPVDSTLATEPTLPKKFRDTPAAIGTGMLGDGSVL